METIIGFLMAHIVPNWALGATFFFAVFFAVSTLQFLARYVKMQDCLKLKFAELLNEQAEKVLEELYSEISKLPEYFDLSGEVRDEFNRALGAVHKTISDSSVSDDPIAAARICYDAVHRYFLFLSAHNIKIKDELRRAVYLYSSYISEVWVKADWKCGDCISRVVRIMRDEDGRFNNLKSSCFAQINDLAQSASYIDNNNQEEEG